MIDSRERNQQQSTGWRVHDRPGTRGVGKVWDMRALQEAWPLHGPLRLVPEANRVKNVSGI